MRFMVRNHNVLYKYLMIGYIDRVTELGLVRGAGLIWCLSKVRDRPNSIKHAMAADLPNRTSGKNVSR
jgi:hypothetical protein